MSSELIKSVPLVGRNLMGLRPAQASLYKYMKKCADTQTTVNLDDVVKIYWTQVKAADHLYQDSYRSYRSQKYIKYSIKNRDIPAYFKNNPDEGSYSYNVEGPARMWMQNTVGSLVMRGLLTVIPNLDIKITENE